LGLKVRESALLQGVYVLLKGSREDVSPGGKECTMHKETTMTTGRARLWA